MNGRHMRDGARLALLPLAVYLLVDMFLDWHGTSVAFGNAVSVHANASAWEGYGAIAGVTAIGLILWEWARYMGADVTQRLDAELTTAMLAVATLLFTVVELFTGSASVQVGATMNVSAGGRLWPAWLGLGLAVLIAAAGVLQLPGSAAHRRHRGGRVRLGHP